MHVHNHDSLVGIIDQIFHSCTHSLSHTLMALPVLFVIYFILELFKKKDLTKFLSSHFAPVIAGLMGIFPQCGASMVSASLYVKKHIKTGTLLAIFLATSDEFIPLVLASDGLNTDLLLIIVFKVIYAIVVGMILNRTIFKNEEVIDDADKVLGCNCCSSTKGAFRHTFNIGIIIFISYFVIECIFIFLGDEFISGLLLKDTMYQPLMAGLIGLIPGCYISVLISQLYLLGTLSIGSTIAGLSSAAGFGYIILFKEDKKKAFKILGMMYVLSVLLGFVVDLII